MHHVEFLPESSHELTQEISSYYQVKEIADLVFMVAGKPALAWNLTNIVLCSECQSQH